MTEKPLVPVQIIGFPLTVYKRSLEHNNELMREFSLIALAQKDETAHEVPHRLLQLVKQLTQDYAGLTDETDARRDEALEAGLESVDLTYVVPATADQASRVLAEMLDEADEFCRSGDALLTLATPREAKLFRDWYLGEFIAQIGGAEPMSWSDYARAAEDGS